MKFNGAIEVNGITTIILNKTVKFEKMYTDYWRYTTKRKRDNVIIPSSIIKSKIQQFINNPYYKVWVHGETINVTKRDIWARNYAN